MGVRKKEGVIDEGRAATVKIDLRFLPNNEMKRQMLVKLINELIK